MFISEEEAKRKIYNVSCERYFGFGCEIDEETSNKLEGMWLETYVTTGLCFKKWEMSLMVLASCVCVSGLPGVLFVLPDSWVDPEYKDYGGEFNVKQFSLGLLNTS